MADENANLDIVDVDSISEMQDPTNESEVPVAQLVREGSSSRQFANIASRDDDFVSKNIFQIKLLLWKRYLEIMAAKMELLKIIGCSLMFFVLLILLDLDLLSFLPDGLLEFFIVPLAFWAFVQRIVIQIVTEKCSRVHESMKICGLTDFAYWTSYFISDGVIIGFILSILCAIMTTGGLFDNGNFGAIFGLFYVFCLSAVPFSFFLSTLMNSPQTSGQLTLLALMGMFIVPVILILTSGGLTVGSISENQAISLLCLFPPMALQLGTLSFTTTDILWPSTYPSTSAICAWMFFDIFMYLILAWYTAQVIPSPVGTTKPFYFIFQPSYWCKCCSSSKEKRPSDGPMSGSPVAPEEQECKSCDVHEAVDEHSLGKPTITVTNLKKSFGAQTAVNNLNFEMYENQIFVLLGHNGAGKTTAINMLTGMSAPDSAEDSKITVYGMDSATQMDEIRTFMGVCPQHDVLFEKLTVKEHIMFFAMLKGLSEAAAEAESNILVRTFHLQKRTDHLGHELSGGQRRKLSFAIAACGGSRFIVLDEPTAGMDPLARRELWDILSTLRHGRTILLTTHYMDEADILGDRVGIMSLGVMQCLGSTQFLKNTYGSGYTIIFDKPDDHNFKVEELTTFIKKHISDATLIEDENGGKQLLYNLPFKNIKEFGPFFLELEKQMLTIESMPSEYGMAVTTLEDVFLKVGADETVKPTDAASLHQDAYHGIGSSISYTPNLQSQPE
jgi:ATP-binding cassette subfamily A (ABC1) protein 3